MNRELGGKVIMKDLRPKKTMWRQKTVHRQIQDHVRRSRRIFKQYLKTGDQRLLDSAVKQIGRFDFD